MAQGLFVGVGPGGIIGRFARSTGAVAGSDAGFSTECDCCCPALCNAYTVVQALTQGYNLLGVCSSPPPGIFPPGIELDSEAGPPAPGPPTEGCTFQYSVGGDDGANLVWSLNSSLPGCTPIAGYWTLQGCFFDLVLGALTSMSWVKTTAGGDAAGSYIPTPDIVGACSLPLSVTVASSC